MNIHVTPTQISIDRAAIPESALVALARAFTFVSKSELRRERRARARKWNYKAKPIHMFTENNGSIHLPSGFLEGALSVLRSETRGDAVRVEWSDHYFRPYPPQGLVYAGPDPVDFQEQALDAILQYRRGLIVAPTSAGKPSSLLSPLLRWLSRSCSLCLPYHWRLRWLSACLSISPTWRRAATWIHSGRLWPFRHSTPWVLIRFRISGF